MLAQQVTIPETKVPPAITAPDRSLLIAANSPAQIEAIEPKPKRTRKTAPKSLPATPEPPDALGTIDNSEPKPKRTRKATAKSPQA